MPLYAPIQILDKKSHNDHNKREKHWMSNEASLPTTNVENNDQDDENNARDERERLREVKIHKLISPHMARKSAAQ